MLLMQVLQRLRGTRIKSSRHLSQAMQKTCCLTWEHFGMGILLQTILGGSEEELGIGMSVYASSGVLLRPEAATACEEPKRD